MVLDRKREKDNIGPALVKEAVLERQKFLFQYEPLLLQVKVHQREGDRLEAKKGNEEELLPS